MTIRVPTVADAHTLADLSYHTMMEAFGPPVGPAELIDQYAAEALTPHVLTTELADPRAHWLLLEIDANAAAGATAGATAGVAIGYAKMRQTTPPRRVTNRRAVELQRIYLLQAWLGQGLGRRLMDACLDQARQMDAGGVFLGVWEHNTRAIQFYESQGFTRVGWHYFQLGTDRQRDIWYYKSL
jgi:diamine N-acetyltransferase